ncbi:hypothetical protein EIN_118120 [Entamoeba invadens IP1]|uniref:Uncharacterized protein n=1 Tax=Entamoeba invadens IP1 TaxID=370355 RepID=L7FMS6_ENTIV|nr:hypothetical protein EIN_118120 [Entamoeba invadens IP1]ELP92238.1 hypothetical protein EIN_118120 [Entamoeba invadens IP1]|eukprot:XP_004259009.1 hypothetical protein EIN_118120 [Entamoeba invadens IP1]
MSVVMTEEERARQLRAEKLAKITGRSDSLGKIEPFLSCSDEEEASMNGQMIRKSDKVKQMSGERPLAFQVEENDHSVKDKKISIITKRFGEDSNVNEVLPFVLDVKDKDEAVSKGKQLKTMEKVKRKMGQD